MKRNQNNAIKYIGYFWVICFLFSACKSKNYFVYYNKVNEIDSLYRIAKQPEKAADLYHKLIRKYRPLNQERIEEFETYIRSSDRYQKNFGGKKSLYKLISLVAPYWKYKKQDPKFLMLFKKYGIDSLEMEREVTKWTKKRDRKLIDSFTLIARRDQYHGRKNSSEVFKNDKKNAELLIWTLENYGFPSIAKVGLWNGDVFMPIGPLLLHMGDYDEYFPYFKTKILAYVKTGECPPRDYAAMVDRNNMHHNLPPTYGVYQGYKNIKDSVKVNQNRKSIGLPSLQYRNKLAKDLSDSLKIK